MCVLQALCAGHFHLAAATTATVSMLSERVSQRPQLETTVL